MDSPTPGQIIVKARRLAKISQQALAMELGVSQANISKIESDARSLDPDTRLKLARILNIDSRELLLATAKVAGSVRMSYNELVSLGREVAA